MRNRQKAAAFAQRLEHRLVRPGHEGLAAKAVDEIFDLRPAAILRDLDLRRPIYAQTAAYGHFGRDGLPWEGLTKVDDIASALSL